MSTAKALGRLPPYILKKNFIDIDSILRHNLYSHYKNPFKDKKKKSHRKKRTFPKNKYAAGFAFGFTYAFRKNLYKLRLHTCYKFI